MHVHSKKVVTNLNMLGIKPLTLQLMTCSYVVLMSHIRTFTLRVKESSVGGVQQIGFKRKLLCSDLVYKTFALAVVQKRKYYYLLLLQSLAYV